MGGTAPARHPELICRPPPDTHRLQRYTALSLRDAHFFLLRLHLAMVLNELLFAVLHAAHRRIILYHLRHQGSPGKNILVFSFKKKNIFILYLFGCTKSQLWHVGSSSFVSACRILSCSILTLSCGMWDLVPRPGIEPKPPALGGQSLSHRTTREVPMYSFFHSIFPACCHGLYISVPPKIHMLKT